MATTVRVTIDQYDQMIRQGLFEPREEHQVELIRGEICPMSPIGSPHESAVDRFVDWSFEALPPKSVWVRVQNSIGLAELESVPQPDIAWVRRRDYRAQRPQVEDVLLVVEVSDSSLHKDRTTKAALYAEAGLPEYWIVNVIDRRIEVHRNPQGSAYQQIQSFAPGAEVRPLAFPEVALPVARIFEAAPGQ